MAIVTLGTGVVTVERNLENITVGKDPMGKRVLVFTYQERLFQDAKPLSNTQQMTYGMDSDKITDFLPEASALVNKIEQFLSIPKVDDNFIVQE